MNDYEQMPAIERTAENTVRITFQCHPVRAADIAGRPIAELEGVTRVRTAYQAVLEDLGISVSPESTRQLLLRVDGVEVVNTVPAPVGPDVWEYDGDVVLYGPVWPLSGPAAESHQRCIHGRRGVTMRCHSTLTKAEAFAQHRQPNAH